MYSVGYIPSILTHAAFRSRENHSVWAVLRSFVHGSIYDVVLCSMLRWIQLGKLGNIDKAKSQKFGVFILCQFFASPLNKFGLHLSASFSSASHKGPCFKDLRKCTHVSYVCVLLLPLQYCHTTILMYVIMLVIRVVLNPKRRTAQSLFHCIYKLLAVLNNIKKYFC